MAVPQRQPAGFGANRRCSVPVTREVERDLVAIFVRSGSSVHATFLSSVSGGAAMTNVLRARHAPKKGIR